MRGCGLEPGRIGRIAGQVTPARDRPDGCPTTTALHQADDGRIARVRLPGGRLPAPAARALAAVATAGDTIELTSRANLQLRRLADAQTWSVIDAIREQGLLPSEAHDRARAILASPLLGRTAGAGLDDDFIAALDAAVLARTDTTTVSGRVLSVVDDGSGHGWSDRADLVARWDATRGLIELIVGGMSAGFWARDEAPAAFAALLGALATAATAHSVWRARELPAAALAELAAGGGGSPVGGTAPAAGDADNDEPSAVAPVPLPVGVLPQADGRAAVRVAAPLGRLTGSMLAALADLAAAHATDLRIDHERTVTLVDLPLASAPVIAEQLGALGLLTEPADPAIGLTACAGRDCTRTEVDVRGAARLRLGQRRPGDGREHLVGCERRCGAPADGITIVAHPTDTAASLASRAAGTLPGRESDER